MPKPIKSSLSPFQQFKRRWQDCTKCELHKVRKTVVLCRGKLPCDILICGEAPGASENSQGEPFVGPAGGLLDQIVCEALRNLNDSWIDLNPVYPDWWKTAPVRLGWTNIICCFPKVEGVKAGEPPKWAVEACAPRLVEFVWLAKPGLIVLVGDHAKKTIVGQADFSMNRDDPEGDWLWLGQNKFLEFCSIVHPARLLRLRTENPSQAVIEYRRAVVTLTDAFELLKQGAS